MYLSITMHYIRILLLILCFSVYSWASFAQTIKGEVIDMDSKLPIKAVSIFNVYTNQEILTNEDGTFEIEATNDQLLIFTKSGYKDVRVRIPKGYMPSYFKIIIQHGFTNPRDNSPNNNRYSPKNDSLKMRDIYGHTLDFERLSGLGKIQHPFSALSKRNREIWKFQEDFEEQEKEKYVDRTFNADLITKITGLTGDSLKTYMVRYRPSYDQLRSMNDYNFFNFIKKTANSYRNPNRPIGPR